MIEVLQGKRQLPSIRELIDLFEDIGCRRYGRIKYIYISDRLLLDRTLCDLLYFREQARLKTVMEACRLHKISFAELMEGQIDTEAFRPWLEWTDEEIEYMATFRDETSEEPTPRPIRDEMWPQDY